MRSQTQRGTEAGKIKRPGLQTWEHSQNLGKGRAVVLGTRPKLYLVPEGHTQGGVSREEPGSYQGST